MCKMKTGVFNFLIKVLLNNFATMIFFIHLSLQDFLQDIYLSVVGLNCVIELIVLGSICLHKGVTSGYYLQYTISPIVFVLPYYNAEPVAYAKFICQLFTTNVILF